MTRGKIICIFGKYLVSSIEFNGDMYPEGRGKNAKEVLEKIEFRDEFESAVKKFNNDYYGYPEDVIGETITLPNPELLDFSRDYVKKWFSDYLYIKNCSDASISFIVKEKENRKTVTLHPGYIATICFGSLEDLEKCGNNTEEDLEMKYCEMNKLSVKIDKFVLPVSGEAIPVLIERSYEKNYGGERWRAYLGDEDGTKYSLINETICTSKNDLEKMSRYEKFRSDTISEIQKKLQEN